MSAPTSTQCLEWFQAQRVQKLDWLGKFSEGKAKRPVHEIEMKTYDVWVLDHLIERMESMINARKSA